MAMSERVEPWLESKLEPDEEVRWWAESHRRLYRMNPLVAGLFSVFALYMAGVCGYLLLSAGRHLTFGSDAGELLLLAFFASTTLFMVFLAIVPWTLHRWRRGRLACAVTDRRAFYVAHRPGRRDRVRSFSPDEINRIVAREYPDGTGNLWIRTETRVKTVEAEPGGAVGAVLGKMRVPTGFAIARNGFVDVPDVRSAAEALAEVVDIVPEIRASAFGWIVGRADGP